MTDVKENQVLYEVNNFASDRPTSCSAKNDLLLGPDDAIVYKGSVGQEDATMKASQSPDYDGVPIDRGWAWMTVLGCFGMHIFVVGASKSLGVLVVELQDRFEDVPTRQLGLVQGISITLMLGLSLFANMLASRFTCRSVVFLGGLMSSTGFILTAFVDKFWMVYLTYSITCGVGFALAYSPSIVFVGSHFKERRSLANGLALSGSGIGTFVLPNMMRVMLNIFGVPGCCMLMGALALHVCACALLYRPHSSYRSKVEKSTAETREPLVKDTDKIDPSIDGSCSNDNSEMCYMHPGKEKLILKVETEAHDCHETRELQKSNLNSKETRSCDDVCNGLLTDKKKDSLLSDHHGNYNTKSHSLDSPPAASFKLSTQDIAAIAVSYQTVNRDTQPAPGQRRFDWSLLFNPVFLLYFAFSIFVNVCYPNVYFMLPAHTENIGHSRDSSALLVSLVGISDLLGRLVIGWFADFKFFHRRYGFVTCALVSGLVNLVLPRLSSFWDIAVYAVIYGFCAGGYMALLAVIMTDTLGPEKLGSSLGLVLLAMSISLIPSPFVCGAIRDMTGSWDYAFTFVGTMATVGSLFPLLQPCAQRFNTARDGSVDKSPDL